MPAWSGNEAACSIALYLECTVSTVQTMTDVLILFGRVLSTPCKANVTTL